MALLLVLLRTHTGLGGWQRRASFVCVACIIKNNKHIHLAPQQVKSLDMAFGGKQKRWRHCRYEGTRATGHSRGPPETKNGIAVAIKQHGTVGVPQQCGGVPEQYDRLIEGSRLIHLAHSRL